MAGEEEEASSNDLPLSANLEDITVRHFTLDLSCHLERQVLEGSITLWCLPTRPQRAAEHQQSPRGDDSAAASCATDDGDRSEQPPSAFSSQLPAIGSCQSVRGGMSIEGGSDERLRGSGQGHCVGTDDRASRASTTSCIGSSPSVRSSNKIDAETADHQFSQTGGARKPIERVMEHASSDRSCSYGHVPCCLHQGAVHSVVGVGTDLSEKEQNEKCTDKSDFISDFKCSAKESDLSVAFKGSSTRLPCVDALDRVCCLEHPEERSIPVPNSNTSGVRSVCSNSDTECDTSEIDAVHPAAVVQPNVLQNSLLPSHKCSSLLHDHTTDMVHGCLKSDCKCDTAVTSVATQENKGAHHPRVSLSCSSSCSNERNSQSEPVVNQKAAGQSESFRMILDSYKLDVQKVEGVYLQGADRLQFEEHPDTFVRRISEREVGYGSLVSEPSHRCPMQFTVKEHCVHVFVEGVHSPQQFPHAVQIWYRTDPLGPSLKWTKDQDDNPCVFTVGHFLSNRSLFPSQDFPTALPTWQASVTVDTGLTVILTGDDDPRVTVADRGRNTFFYFTHFPMPSTTFAMAVGSWQMETLQYGPLLHDTEYQNMDKPPIRLFSPSLLKEKSLSVLGDYLPRCMLEVQRMLGVYPFRRLDVLVVPACFDSLGMASPSLLFLSQSVLCVDGSMCVRVAHELCHTWFGLVMGPRDWTEEWMTEGFCTYLEDVLHAQVVQLGELTEDYLGLRAELHLRVLKAEIENTDESLQSLRPNQGKGDSRSSSGEETRFLKNGMNAEKKFMQVHYLKGYFLLRSLEREVGRSQFLTFLKEYVHRYFCQLVTSQEFLQMFFSTFSDLTHISVESINTDWLDCPGMPKILMGSVGKSKGVGDEGNALVTQVQQQLTSIIKMCRHQPRRKRRHGGQLSHNQQLLELNQMQTPQLVMMFDRLLDEKRVPDHVLDLLRNSCDHHLDNAEVCHRWCELVIKHRHKKWYSDVQHFLINHQAMGVYLYGEASISRNPDVVQLARSCFRQLQHDMPESVRDTVSAMLYGT